MMKMIDLKLLGILLLSFMQAFLIWAGEVDNYLAWEKDIPDSYILFNQFLNDRIGHTVGKINRAMKNGSQSAHVYKECENVSMEIIKKLGTNYLGLAALNAEFELWAQDNPLIESYPINTTTNDEMRTISLYGPSPSFVESFFISIDRVVNVGGIYFGTDKLSHFTGSGYLYYGNYLKAKKRGKSEIDAIKYAVKKGYMMEGGIIGIKSTGVFSYADLEANFQGMLMTIDMCEGETPYLSSENGKWELTTEIDFRNYVNPYWDESFNTSGYTPKRIKKMFKMIKKNGYCDLLHSEWVANQRAGYMDFITRQAGLLSSYSRPVAYSFDLIQQMQKAEKKMQTLLHENKIYAKDKYELSQLCSQLRIVHE